MRVLLADSPTPDLDVEVLVVAAFEGDEGDPLDARLGGKLRQARESKELTGKAYETTLLYADGKVRATRVLVVGFGKRDDLTPERARNVGGATVRRLRRREVRRAAFAVPANVGADVVRALADGAVVGDFDNGVYKTGDRTDRTVEELSFGLTDARAPLDWEEPLRWGRVVGDSANLARSLAIEPGNRLAPKDLADRAAAMCGERGLEVDVLDENRLREMGAGALLGVAQGSDQPPRLIVMRYKSGFSDGPTLAIVGKGVTFDSGGISIKPGQGMQDMKYDMSGGAAAIGAMAAIAQLKPAVDVIGVVPATENLLGPKAMRPGDVLMAMNGKTIEVTNTDAEGRLILADAIVHAQRLGAKHVIDAATLTGGVVTALGHAASGLFGTPQEWIDRVRKAGERVGERLWQLPLYPEYREQLKSDVADIGNSAGRPASPCTGATFIKEFVESGTSWAHLDIAGTAWIGSDKPYIAAGPTAAALRTFVQVALEMGSER